MLSELLSTAGVGVLLLMSRAWVTKLALGMIVIIRARKQDLPEIVRGLAGWFYRQRR